MNNIYDQLASKSYENNKPEFILQLNDIVDINQTYSDKETLLLRAAAWDDLEIVKVLIEKGADPNIPEKDQFSPFLFAVMNGSIPMVQFLHDHGADIHAVDCYGNNALGRALFCSKSTSFHITLYLLRLGVDPDRPNNYGNSARKTAMIISNYDFRSLYSCYEVQKKCPEKVLAITDKKVLDGAPVQLVNYYGIDDMLEFLSSEKVSMTDMRICFLSDIYERVNNLPFIRFMLPNHKATKMPNGSWAICDLYDV